MNLNALTQKNNEKSLLFGINYGQASQNIFSFNNSNYFYRNDYLKIQINCPINTIGKLQLELHFEPSIYFSEHQLLNYKFVRKTNPDYVALRDQFTKRRNFTEYALNIGAIARYPLAHNFSIYVLASSGPMNSKIDTERLKKGFAFSDILGLGFSHKKNKVRFDLRFTIRHNSNANISFPNSGHNSIGMETGISYQLK